uniref:TWiK family of potassium channels protein 7 n=1 Tax=Bursaphelenchus xylophilus TaxID=6326 RepID=A0A1I7RTJ9_BURXY
MFFFGRIRRIRSKFSAASPVFIHVFMVVSVAAYTLFGAYVMRSFENSEIEKINRENGYLGPPGRSKRAADSGEIVLSGPELSALAPGLRGCVQNAIHDMLLLAGCTPDELNKLSITALDDCYRYADIHLPNKTKRIATTTPRTPTTTIEYRRFQALMSDNDEGEEEVGWSFHNAVVFAFTVITTIGYGNVAPVTTAGRAFCVVYGLIGVPLALLTIADIGMFLNKFVKFVVKTISNLKDDVDRYRFQRRKLKKSASGSTNSSNDTVQIKDIEEANNNITERSKSTAKSESSNSSQEERRTSESVTLAVIFGLYLITGSFIISLYEPEMNFFTAVYFTFVSLTTIGLGDIVPKRYDFLILTFAYITVGLALTTMAIEIAAEFLKKLHYFGRKIEDVASVDIWFGGRKMKLKSLIRHLGDQLNIPVEELDKFDINNFVGDAMKVKDGELKTLRKEPKPVSYDDVKRESDLEDVEFADELLSYTSEENPLKTARNGDGVLLNKTQSAR